jgi:hypothetical protein
MAEQRLELRPDAVHCVLGKLDAHRRAGFSRRAVGAAISASISAIRGASDRCRRLRRTHHWLTFPQLVHLCSVGQLAASLT